MNFIIVQQLFQIEDEENNFINYWQFLTSILLFFFHLFLLVGG